MPPEIMALVDQPHLLSVPCSERQAGSATCDSDPDSSSAAGWKARRRRHPAGGSQADMGIMGMRHLALLAVTGFVLSACAGYELRAGDTAGKPDSDLAVMLAHV